MELNGEAQLDCTDCPKPTLMPSNEEPFEIFALIHPHHHRQIIQTDAGAEVVEQINFESLRFYLDEYGVKNRVETIEKINLIFEISQKQKQS